DIWIIRVRGAECAEVSTNDRTAMARKWTSEATGRYLDGGKESGGMLVDQRFCTRIVEGELCYSMVADKLVGIIHEKPKRAAFRPLAVQDERAEVVCFKESNGAAARPASGEPDAAAVSERGAKASDAKPATGALGAGAGAAKLRGAGASDGLHLVSPCGGLDKRSSHRRYDSTPLAAGMVSASASYRLIHRFREACETFLWVCSKLDFLIGRCSLGQINPNWGNQGKVGDGLRPRVLELVLDHCELHALGRQDLARPAEAQRKPDLIEKWPKEEELQCAEELTDVFKTLDSRGANILVDQCELQKTSPFLLEALMARAPCQAQLRVLLLALDTRRAPRSAATVLQRSAFTHCDGKIFRQLRCVAGLMQRALAHRQTRPECLRELVRRGQQNMQTVAPVTIELFGQTVAIKNAERPGGCIPNEGALYSLGAVRSASAELEAHPGCAQAGAATRRRSGAFAAGAPPAALEEVELPSLRRLNCVCDLRVCAAALTERLRRHSCKRRIEVYSSCPPAVGARIDAGSSAGVAKDLLRGIRGAGPVEALATEAGGRSRLRALRLSSRRGPQMAARARAWATRWFADDAGRGPGALPKARAFVDSAIAGGYFRDPRLTRAGYKRARGSCDDQFAGETSKNGPFRPPARYLVERQSPVVHQIARTSPPASTNADDVSVAAKAFIEAWPPAVAIELPGEGVSRISALSKNENSRNFLILTGQGHLDARRGSPQPPGNRDGPGVSATALGQCGLLEDAFVICEKCSVNSQSTEAPLTTVEGARRAMVQLSRGQWSGAIETRLKAEGAAGYAEFKKATAREEIAEMRVCLRPAVISETEIFSSSFRCWSAQRGPEKHMDFTQTYTARLRIPKLTNARARLHLWGAAMFLRSRCGEYGQAAGAAMARGASAYTHFVFLMAAQRSSNMELDCRAISSYLGGGGRLRLNAVLSAISSKACKAERCAVADFGGVCVGGRAAGLCAWTSMGGQLRYDIIVDALVSITHEQPKGDGIFAAGDACSTRTFYGSRRVKFTNITITFLTKDLRRVMLGARAGRRAGLSLADRRLTSPRRESKFNQACARSRRTTFAKGGAVSTPIRVGPVARSHLARCVRDCGAAGTPVRIGQLVRPHLARCARERGAAIAPTRIGPPGGGARDLVIFEEPRRPAGGGN
ncbi:unnamed protein product, partial [Prorocentrum cordatum]